MKELGIKTQYDAERAVVNCDTSYSVEFTVSLFLGRGKFSKDFIVEVRRTYNASMEFMKDCRSILNAAQGVDDTERNMGTLKL